MERKLAAILAADVAGFSRLVADNEEQTLNMLGVYRGVIADLVGEHGGRIFGTAGDSVIADFSSPVLAVRSAVAIQRALDRHNADLLPNRRMDFRIGVNLGDVVVEGADLLGDGVNLAARLEQMAEPGGILVSSAVWEQVEGKVPFPCAYQGERTVKNLARPVRVYSVDWKQPDMLGMMPDSTDRPPTLPDKPSIAVLPFNNMSGDSEQEYFADGISEDIITALAKWRWLFVIARNTSFTYKGRAFDIKQIGRDLGVRYVLEGSVRKTGGRVRINAQLIEASTGAHIWSERYDRDLADAFGVQDEITENVVGAIEPQLLQVERQRAVRQSRENLDAWDHYARGLWRFYQFNADDLTFAERHMRSAIECDPTLAQGYIGLARVLNLRIWMGWSEDLSADAMAAYGAARRAVEIDERDSYAHYILAWASMLVGEQENALAEAQKSIDLTPNFALAYFALGAARLLLGRFDQVANPMKRAMRLSPHEPLTFLFSNFLALSEYHQQNYDEAVRVARQGIAIRPFYLLFRTLAACYGQLGKLAEARDALIEMRKLKPRQVDDPWDLTFPYADPAHIEHFRAGLRKAGLTE